MRKSSAEQISVHLTLVLFLAGLHVTLPTLPALAHAIPPVGENFDLAQFRTSRELQLEVFINGTSTKLVAAFLQEADGKLAIEPVQLRNIGIRPAEDAMRDDGLVDIARLGDVSFDYDEASQSIYFTVAYDARSTRVIDAHGNSTQAPESYPRANVGAVMNYTIFASTGGNGVEDLWRYEGVSGWFEGRLYGPHGVLDGSYVARGSTDESYESTRLDTTWSYSDPGTMVTYRVGDVITGGLSWSRSARLGGIQIQRNFGLRPDLLTMPLPEFSGSAAVPSTVDVYVNNARRLSQEIPAGPFEIANLPVITGSGTARLVIRDALGRETVTESIFFASSDLLAPELWDFSAEAGFGRRFYGIESNDYDDRFMTSATVRYGLNDWLTLEGHGEAGGGLVNGGAGAVFGLGPRGVGSFAASASSYSGRSGYQIAGSIELALGDLHFQARTQRTFGHYDDIASVTTERLSSADPNYGIYTAAPPQALDQVSVSVPLRFDPATLNFSYTHLENADNERSQIVAASFSRRAFERGTIFATAFMDLENDDSFGVFAGLSIPLGNDIHSTSGVSSDSDGTAFTTELIKSEGGEAGSYGWRIRDSEGADTNRAASASYRAPVARFEAGVEQIEDYFRATGQIDGAVVVAGGDVFLANRIDDAFAVVDTGAPGVAVEYENRPVGRTNRNGKLLVPALRSYEPNRITIDPTDLPVNATIGGTRKVAVPADRSGTIVAFAVDTDPHAALVTLRDEAGAFLQIGATGRLKGAQDTFVVGYDGQAFITGLRPQNRVVVDQPSRSRCIAEFSFTPREGEQVAIAGVICHPAE